MKIRIGKAGGFWKIWFVYHYGTDYEYEVFMDKYTDFSEAIGVANDVILEGSL